MFVTVGLVTLVGYVIVFSWVENNRRKDGPWEITFAKTNNSPVLLINHAKSGLTNIAIVFSDAVVPTNLPQTVSFPHGRVAPFDLPFGKCIFLDSLYLPGSVTVQAFGHEIQLLPRTLIIDRVERAWSPGEKILLTNRTSVTLPAN
jgi:hypothetical protein